LKYSLDTSSLINGFRLHYPYLNCPRLWNEHFPELVARGDLRATEEVRVELERQDDELVEWIKNYSSLFIEVDETIQLEVKAILKSHPGLIHARGRGHSGADPFVIALAKLHLATVVTEEGRSGSPKHPKIPDVCDELGVPCIRLTDLIIDEDWIF
jgi:hypothetical protein